jgi:hypothetical protein
MKTSTDNKTSKWMIASALVSVIALTGLAAKAQESESGEGRNGPDKAGVSIPVSVDRMLTVAELEIAAQSCKEDQLVAIASQILRIDSTKFKYQKIRNGIAFLVFNENAEQEKCLTLVSSPNTRDLLLAHTHDTVASVDQYTSPLTYHGQFCSPLSQGHGDGYLENNKVDETLYTLLPSSRSGSFGTFVFKGGISVDYKFANDGTPDELGGDSDASKVVTSMSLKNENFSRALMDGTTRPVAFKNSLSQFKQCLQNQIGQ